MDKNVIGIDFGTTKTLVSYYDTITKKADIPRLGKSKDEMPTSIFISETEIFYGEDAEDEAAGDYSRYIKDFKLKLGKNSPVCTVNEKEYTAIKLTSLFLKNLKEKCEEEVFYKKITKAVITVPVSFSISQKNDLKKAAENAGFAEVELLKEPESAGNAFLSMNNSDSFNDNVLIVDWGGGTVDVALLSKNDRGDIVTNREYSYGDDSMGGIVFDEKLWNYVEFKLKNITGKSINDEPLEYQYTIRKRIKETKESFSRKEVHKLHLAGRNIKIYNTEISRSEFNACINTEVEAFMGNLEKLLKSIPENLKPKSIILIGGSCNVLLIKEQLESKFKLPCIKWHRSDEAVALGASCLKGINAEKNENSSESNSTYRTESLPKATRDTIYTYIKLADQGRADYQYRVGEYYNEDAHKDEAMALKYCKKSAEQCNANAQCELGIIYIDKNEEEGIKWLKEAMAKNEPISFFVLGSYYLEKEDKEEATKLFDKGFRLLDASEDKDDEDIQYSLGFCYEKGLGVNENPKEAFKWYKKSADQGNADAQFEVGACYETAYGVSENPSEAIKWYNKSAEQGNEDAKAQLNALKNAANSVQKKNMSVFDTCKELAEQGNANAQYDLGFYYDMGFEVEEDAKEAFKWYKKSAEQGNALAQYSVGTFYQYGIGGVKENAKEAFSWYVKSAEQGNEQAQYKLGYFYETGVGGMQSNYKALACYKKSAEQGDANAQYELGRCYLFGKLTCKDAKEAIKWYKKSADQGNPNAQHMLGHCYLNGYGVPKNPKEAFKWNKKSAEQGNADAQYALGGFYLNGYGTTENEAKAIVWYEKSAEQGNADAQYDLGVCYHYGYGTAENETKALYWYLQSAELGNADAIKALRDF